MPMNLRKINLKKKININTILNDRMSRNIQTAICSNTTANDHYKNWEIKTKSKGFSEHPSYAGDSLFPNRQRTFVTSNKNFYQPVDITKLEHNQKKEIITNLKPEGK